MSLNSDHFGNLDRSAVGRIAEHFWDRERAVAAVEIVDRKAAQPDRARRIHNGPKPILPLSNPMAIVKLLMVDLISKVALLILLNLPFS
jgi:hypothetical protein